MAYALRADSGRSGAATNPSYDAEGRLRKRGAGFNVSRDLAPTLDASQPHIVIADGEARRLTPVECERLQGFPDGWTDVPLNGKAPGDGPRHAALGNTMPVPLVRWIGRRIQRVAGKRALRAAASPA